jgi:hypothetical protein
MRPYLNKGGFGGLVLVLLASPLLHAAELRFLPATSFSTGSDPFDLVAQDFNQDETADVAVANRTSGDVTVLWGLGDGSFLSLGITFPVGDLPVAIAAGQLTDDVNLDLVVANRGSQNLSVLIGAGSATSFSEPSNTTTAGAATGIALADFDGDSRVDAVSSEGLDDAITVWLGNADVGGTFGSPRSSTVSGGPLGVSAGKLDDDDNVDLAVTIADLGVVALLHGNGDGTFEVPDCTSDPLPAGCQRVGTSPSGITLADLDGNGSLDVVVANQDSDDVSVLFNNGSGALEQVHRLDAGNASSPTDVEVADFNGDGLADIASANSRSNNVAVFLGAGDRRFEPAVFFPSAVSPLAVEVSDVNNDGRTDILTANFGSDDISLLLNDTLPPTPSITPSPTATTTGNPVPTFSPTETATMPPASDTPAAPTLTPTPTQPISCIGDCDGSGAVTVDELVMGVAIALGTRSPDDCLAFDATDDGRVTVDELVLAVDAALNGC